MILLKWIILLLLILIKVGADTIPNQSGNIYLILPSESSVECPDESHCTELNTFLQKSSTYISSDTAILFYPTTYTISTDSEVNIILLENVDNFYIGVMTEEYYTTVPDSNNFL